MVFSRILRVGEGKILRKLHSIADQVNSIEDEFVAMTDAELRQETDSFRARLADGETLDDLLPEAFANVREAAKRTLGQRHFDVQLMGGAALHMGNIAEMKTGEGKTLVGTLPAYLNALEGKGVHVVTVNDYLARRDAEWMGRVHRFLGLSVGLIQGQMRPDERRPAYNSDITYGTNNEFGFDYLRDNMAWTIEECVQRGHNFAIVDEVDSILIDEARTPLIISGPSDQATQWYATFAGLVRRLEPGEGKDYEVDEGKRTVAITERGVQKVEDYLGIENLYESINTPLVGYLNNALKAKELYHRDKDYIVTNGEVLIVDEFTGRILHGRRYSEGMHQAIEAKEGVKIMDENQTLATITLQNFFRLYDKLSGMTGTAMTEAAEFDRIYKLGVVPIPTNRPMQRIDRKDVVYKTEAAKFEAVVEDIAEKHEKGQPVLVGTVSVEKSERLSGMLLRRGIPHEVLNAKFHEKEAEIVAQAGRKGSVTVATNMAGRGTDIMLGGNPEFMAASELRNRGLSPVDTPEDYEAAWPDALEKAKAAVATEHDEVTSIGGLYVLGTERHESRRIDNQLRGRSGRQGDPGESRFYLSLQDDLMRLFNAAAVESIMDRLNIPDDVPIEAGIVTRAIRNAQTQIESQNFEIRKNVLKYDEVLNTQREVIYGERRKVLEGHDLHDQVRGMIEDVIDAYVTGATTEGFPEDWDLDQLWTALKTLYPIGVSLPELEEENGGRSGLSSDYLKVRLTEDALAAYDRREESLGVEVTRELERRVILSVLDRKWREHLYEMDYLQEGIGLRAVGQRDPLIEYKREGYELFVAMMDGIKEESVGFLFNVEVQVQQPPDEARQPAPGFPQGVAADEPVSPVEPPEQAPAVAAPFADAPSSPNGETPYAAAAPAAEPGAEPVRGDLSGATAPNAPLPGEPQPVVTAPAVQPPAAVQGTPQSQPPAAAAGAPARPHVDPQVVLPKELVEPHRPSHVQYTAPSLDGGSGIGPRSMVNAGEGNITGQAVGSGPARNAPCPCGSGKKYKKCHGAPQGAV